LHGKKVEGVTKEIMKNIAYVTDEKGKKKNVLLRLSDFERMQEDIEDLEDALALERARSNATGFKKWKDFIKEVETDRKG
jgi:PHD/YefM family antitoxin component YafN of YafNO toxin-antitoxin module